MNRYGLDVSYFEDLIKREFSDLNNYTPAEFARVCARMAASADSSVLDELEFSASSRCDHYPVPFGSQSIWRCHKCGLGMDEPELAEKVERLTMVIGGRMCGKTSQANKSDVFKASEIAHQQAVIAMKESKFIICDVFNEIQKKENISLETALRHKKISDSLSPNWVQINDNQKFIQRKMQGKRRIY